MKRAPWVWLLLAGALLVVAGCDTTPADLVATTPPPPPVIPPPPPAPVPLVLSVNPPSRRATAQPGTPAPGDNATVSLSGDNATTTTWTAQHKHPWIILLAGTGTGNGTTTWMRNTAGLVAGIYVDTITITAPGAVGSPAKVIDTLQVTAAPVPLLLSVSPASRRAIAIQGSTAPGDNIAITLTGDAAISATWSITKHAAWAAVTPISGTGSDLASWTRTITGLAAGTYVDTIIVAAPGAAGSPVVVLDTLIILPPLVVQVAPTSISTSVVSGATGLGTAAVTFSGTGAGTAAWTATRKKSWTIFTTAAGAGAGTVAWASNATTLAPGTYVDTISVSAVGALGSPARVIDTLIVTALPVPLSLTVNPHSVNTTAAAGAAAPGASASVTLSGDHAASAAWSASKRKAWTTLTTASGTGTGPVAWSHNTAGLLAGTYVDTIAVSAPGAAGSPTAVLDTLIITPALAMQVMPPSIKTSVVSGSSAPGGTAAVTFSGTGAATATWTATKKKSWTTLTTASGTGAGSVVWTRNATGLAAGTYVDTISVTAAGAIGSPARVIDSLVITAAPVPLSLSASPRSISTTTPAGSVAPAVSAAVTLSGTNAASTTWNASKRKAWTTLTTASGTGSGTVAWSHSTTGLVAGTYVDTITITAAGALNSPTTVIDTLVITPVSSGGPDLGLNADLHGKMLFPANNLWNRPVDTAQVDPASATILGAIGLGVGLHPDFGASWNGGPFGIPYIVVPDATARVSVPFDYASESDPGPYPIPANPPIEPGGGDSHLLVVTQNEWKLYELYALFSNGHGGWTAGSGAIWNLTTGAPRPAGWTSADAAGLPILLGLVRYDEVYLHGEIDHALRFTVQHTRASYVAPASHVASSSSNLAYAPMGMRVRLKASFDISGYPPQAQVILRALKKYGMIVADNGSNFFLSGTADARWNDAVNNTLKQVKVGNFEVVRMTGIVTP